MVFSLVTYLVENIPRYVLKSPLVILQVVEYWFALVFHSIFKF